MDFSVSQKKLLNGLSRIMGAVERKQAEPILSHVLLKLNGDELYLIASDGETEIHSKVQLDSAYEISEITLPARKLFEMCRNLDDTSEIKFELQQQKMLLYSQKSKFVLATLPADSFPLIQNDQTKENQFLKISERSLHNLISQTAFSMAYFETRAFMNGALLEIEKNSEYVRMVTTDGHRLSLAQDNGESKNDEKIQIIIPRKSIVELGRLLQDEEVELLVEVNKNYIIINSNYFVFISKLIESTYPNYEAVRPSSDKEIILDKMYFSNLLRRCGVLQTEKVRKVSLGFKNNRMIAFSESSQSGECVEEQMDIEYHGDDIKIILNSIYLLDILNVITCDKIRLEMVDEKTNVIISPYDDIKNWYLIVPYSLVEETA